MATVQVDLMHTSKARNSTRVPSTTEGHITETICYLKEPTSIIKPTLIIQGADSTFEGKQFPDYNYCYIKDFHRYYFITNVTSISALVWQIDCEVDVLATYRKEILQAKGFIQYAQTGYNKYLGDPRLPQSTQIYSTVYSTTLANLLDSSGIYTLTVANNTSSNGFATTYLLTSGQLNSLVEKINSGIDEIKNYFTNPLEAIVRCSWLPTSAAIAGQGSAEIVIGKYSTGVTAAVAKDQVRGGYVTTYTPATIEGIVYNGYLMVEPYHELYRFLPGVGVVQLPLCSFFHTGESDKLEWLMEVSFAPATGDIAYIFHAGNDYSNAIALTVQGNIATELPVSATSANGIGIAAGVGSVLASTATVIATGGNLGATAAVKAATQYVGGAVGATLAMQTTTNIKGSMSSMATKQYAHKFFDRSIYHLIGQAPSASLSTIGLPVMKTETLGSHTGLVKATGVWVEAECTDTEHQLIAQFVNSSTNFIYGGLIIE